MKNRCALLDTDFISKLHITRKDDNNRMIDRIIELPDFDFICHEQITVELSRHNLAASVWLQEKIEIREIQLFTDEQLLSDLVDTFGESGYQFFMNLLHSSCGIFSKNFFSTYYKELMEYVYNKSQKCNQEFIDLLRKCDCIIGADNNLGEIKTYTMSQILNQLGNTQIYVFCSDDRKARGGIVSIDGSVNCVSAIVSFYLAEKYLNMKIEEAKLYFDSWMQLHKKTQTEFKVYDNTSSNRLIKMDGYQILTDIYEKKLGLWKDGYLKKRV